MDPVIQQIARARSIEPHFLRKMKEHFIGVVQPQLDERERLLEENATLREEVETLRAQVTRARGVSAAKPPIDAVAVGAGLDATPSGRRRR
jgi:hypothetical protein